MRAINMNKVYVRRLTWTESLDISDGSRRTMSPRDISRYLQPWFWASTSQGAVEPDGQELRGRTSNATNAERTAPKEKNMDSAVTRYCFSLGMCSKRRVPSVGMDP